MNLDSSRGVVAGVAADPPIFWRANCNNDVIALMTSLLLKGCPFNIPAPRLFGAVFVWTGLGMAYWSRKERINAALKTEKRSIELALQPMLSAERDRALIKHIIQSRQI